MSIEALFFIRTISDNKLNGNIPEEIGNLINLEEL